MPRAAGGGGNTTDVRDLIQRRPSVNQFLNRRPGRGDVTVPRPTGGAEPGWAPAAGEGKMGVDRRRDRLYR
jgi:hypothetical protein